MPNRGKLRPEALDLIGWDDGPPEKKNAAPVGSRDGGKQDAIGHGKNSSGRREDIQARIDALIGDSDPSDSPLDVVVKMTEFPDVHGYEANPLSVSMRDFHDEIEHWKASEKARLPLIVGGEFGDERSSKGSLRHAANRENVTAIVVDYDAEVIAFTEAKRRVEEADVACFLYTSPSHSPEAPRWRAVFPLSTPMATSELGRLTDRANGLFDGTLAGESWSPVQPFYAGQVTGRPPMRKALVDGDFLDARPDLPRVPSKHGSTTRHRDKAEDPTAKRGEVGAWCRTHTVVGVIEDHLSDVYVKAGRGRYRYAKGSSKVGGVAVYDEGRFAYSNHDSDPARGLNNAFDLMMKHRFGHLDEGLAPDIAMSDRPSYRAMCEHARRDPAVAEELAREESDLIDEFDVESTEAITTGGGSAVPYSEDAIALAFAREFEGRLLFDVTAGVWNRFDEKAGLWRPERGGLAHHWARITCRRIAARDPRKTGLGSAKTAEAVERLARRDPVFAVDGDVWNRDQMLIGTPMGVVDLRTGELRPGRPEDRINRSTAVAPIPLDELDADEHCPVWMRYLRDATGGDRDVMGFLRRFAGYCLTGSVREHALLFLHGPGGSGKSKFVETLQGFMGEWAETMSIATLSATKYDRHPEEIARLRGVRMAWSSETERGSGWAESKLKLLTGGDRLVARFMRQDSFEFDPTHKLIVIGNHAPSLESIGSDMRRRFNIVAFDHVPAKPDVHLPEKLQREWPGILSWAIRGCLDWQRRGLERPEAVTKATDDYFRSQDHFARWIEQDADLDRTAKEKTADLWESWNGFCRANGIEAGTRDRSFVDDLKRPEFRLKRADIGRSKDRGWAGIRLKDPYGF